MGYSRMLNETEIAETLARKIETLESELLSHRRTYQPRRGTIDTTETRINGKIAGLWVAADALHVGALVGEAQVRIQQTQRRIA